MRPAHRGAVYVLAVLLTGSYIFNLPDPADTGVSAAAPPIAHIDVSAAAPVALPSAIPSTLKIGMKGAKVRALQARLNDLVWVVCFNHKDSNSTGGVECPDRYKITVDGRFGKQTKEAVVMFQRQQGLVADGIVGPKTWAKLYDPDSGCVVAKRTALALGASEREANFIAYIGWQESRCHLHQVVDRPSTGDFSWGPYGFNYFGGLVARAQTYGKPYVNIISWRRATANVLMQGRGHGWCHWIKNRGQYYCSGPAYQAGDPPPVVDPPS